jgi:hypothetical protein
LLICILLFLCTCCFIKGIAADDDIESQQAPFVSSSVTSSSSSVSSSISSSSTTAVSSSIEEDISSSIPIEESSFPEPIISCLNNCSGHGYCNYTTLTCVCEPHFESSDCSWFDDPDLIACPNLCSNHGECNTTTGKCNCFQDYFSADCSLVQCPNNCSERAPCNHTTGVCDCPYPYFNLDCSLIHCPNDCFSELGYGVCDSTTGSCDCNSTLYTGVDCSLRVCPNDCSGHGTCDTRIGKCNCTERYHSADCSLKSCIDPSCNGVGKCDEMTGTCICDSMHQGESCELRLCERNCTYPHGICDMQTGKCKCNADWSGDETCGVNIHILSLLKIKNWNTILGTIWIIGISIGLPFFVSSTLTGQLCMGLISMIQFIGLSSLTGSYVPPLFLKFCAFFEWSNFIFDLNVRTHQFKQQPTDFLAISNRVTLMDAGNKYFDLRQEMNDNGLIVFLDNFILVCMVVILTLIFNGMLIAYKMTKSQQRQLKSEYSLINSLIHLALIAYLGVSSSVMYEIQLAFRGRLIVITLLVAFALLIGYLFGIPIMSIFALYQIRTKSNTRSSAHQETALAPMQHPFKSEFYLFIAVIFVKNFLVSTLFGFFTTSAKDQEIGLLIILSTYLMIVLVTKPFVYKLRNMFEIAMVSCQIMSVITVLLFSVRAITNKALKSLFCAVFIVIPNVLLIGVVVFYLAYRLYIHIRYGSDSSNNTLPYTRSGHMLLDEEDLNEFGNRSLFDEDPNRHVDPPMQQDSSPATKRSRKKDLFTFETEEEYPSFEMDEDEEHAPTKRSTKVSQDHHSTNSSNLEETSSAKDLLQF